MVDDRPEHFLVLPCPLNRELLKTKDWAEHLNGASPFQGTISLGSQGCAYATQLIVSGPNRGQILYVDADENGPPYLTHEPNFLSWYERWLDELLLGYDFGWFGFGPAGGEDDFFRILDSPESDDDLKAEASTAFCRLPRLSDSAAPRIDEYLDHPHAGVRVSILWTIRHYHLTDFFDQAMQRIGDPSADVRKQAVITVMKFDPERSAKVVLRRLREDPDEQVANAAFSSLKNAGALTKAEMMRLVESPKWHSLLRWAVGVIRWEVEDEPLLIRLLENSDWNVRSNAVLGLRGIEGRNALPQMLDLLSREQDANVVGAILTSLGKFGEPSTVPVLLEWVESADDFHRLDAMKSLANIGDERAVKPARAMLQEHRKAARKLSRIDGRNISEVVRQSLRESPNPTLRQVAE